MHARAVLMPEITTKFNASSLKIPAVAVSTWQHRGLMGNLFPRLGRVSSGPAWGFLQQGLVTHGKPASLPHQT